MDNQNIYDEAEELLEESYAEEYGPETEEQDTETTEEKHVVEHEQENTEKKKPDTKTETKSEKFVRLAEYRMNKAILAISKLGNLANTSAYEFTEDQTNTMFDVLQQEIDNVKNKFSKTTEKKNFKF